MSEGQGMSPDSNATLYQGEHCFRGVGKMPDPVLLLKGFSIDRTAMPGVLYSKI